jgi:hypothetical protein
MKKINEIYTIFIFYNFKQENIKPSFLDSLYCKSGFKIGIVKKIWFDCLIFRILLDIYCIIKNKNNFLYL